ncbi:hypothetical protein [Pontiella sp.]|uniref:hypothetical protein n=1 Tax=Pontiella sp. TaxID=2837462 RepID=UPI003566127E
MNIQDNLEEPRAHTLDNVGDWFAIGSVFSPLGILHKGINITGMRSLLCIDTGSHYIMSHSELPKKPTTLTSGDILPFVADVMVNIGVPRCGFIFLKSSFLSSAELASDPETQEQGKFLKDIGCSFDAMLQDDKNEIAHRIQFAKTKIIFQGLARIEADVTLAHSEIKKTRQ